MRILSQSFSVFGDVSMAPFSVYTILTASNMLSAAGSSMSRINSFTDTIGLRSPHSWGTGTVGGVAVAVVPDAGGVGFDEHANRTLITISSPTQRATGGRRH